MVSKSKKTNEIRELTDYQHIRLRTPMYLGSTDATTEAIVHRTNSGMALEQTTFIPALLTMMSEVIDNAVDEIVGHRGGKKIDVTFDPATLTITVADDGRGVPLDKAQLVFSSPRAGRNFDQRENVIGANGIGASAVNFVSDSFIVDIWRDNEHFHQKFSEDPKGASLKIGKAIRTPATRRRGTRVEYTPSSIIFPERLLPEKLVEGRIRELAFAYPEVKWSYNGEKLSSTNFFPLKPITVEIQDDAYGFITTFYLFPQFHPEKDDHVHAIVNSRLALKGGEHIKAFKSVFYNGMAEALKTRKLKPTKADIAAELLIFSVTRMAAPMFDSQSKTFLANAEANRIIRKGFDEKVFKQIISRYPEWVEQIYERARERTGARDDKDVREQTRKKVKVPKLTPANDKDRSKCILILGEGDSALTKAVENRDPAIHGILPLKGKINNAYEKPAKDMFSAPALLDLVAAIGLEYKKPAVVENLNYGQVWVATDEDVDGDHILCLLVVFFYRFWPELFSGPKPFIFKLNTPFIILKKGDKREYIYSENEKSFDPSKYKGWKTTRAKGLGKLENPEWHDILHGKPNLTAIMDDGKMKEMLDLLFSDERRDDRKTWLSD